MIRSYDTVTFHKKLKLTHSVMLEASFNELSPFINDYVSL